MRGYPKKIRVKAVNLRKKGLSLSEISYKLKIPKNSIQGWVKDVKLSSVYKIKIKERIIAGGLKGRKIAREVIRDKIESWKKNVRDKASAYVNIIYKNNKMEKLIAGILYLCEGAKYPSTRHLVFGNSDPRMIKFFLKLLRNNFNLDNKKFRCRIMHRWDQDGVALDRYWSKETGIPLGQFYRSYMDKRTKGIATTKRDYKGICSIQYFDTNIQFELQSIGEMLLDN